MEIDSFMEFLRQNGKMNILNCEWTLLYRKSKDGNFGDETFVKPRYENKQNIICLFHTEDNHVLGGFISIPTAVDTYGYQEDPNAFIYYLRTKNTEKEPQQFKIKNEFCRRAIFVQPNGCIAFGSITMAIFANNHNNKRSNFILTGDADTKCFVGVKKELSDICAGESITIGNTFYFQPKNIQVYRIDINL